MKLYQAFEIDEETPVQYLAVHPLRWRSEWGEPAIMFREVDDETQTLADAAPALLAACEEAYEFLDDRTDTYPEPCEDVPTLSVMITLKFAIDKAKAKGDPCTE